MRIWLLALMVALQAAPVRAAEAVVAYTITNGSEIAESLTGEPGDAGRGRLLYAAERAGCPVCHGFPGGSGAAEPAPDLSDVGARSSAGALRLWIVAPEVLSETGEMPAFYAPGQRDDPDDPLYGGPALTASEIEDLVAYLVTLRDQD